MTRPEQKEFEGAVLSRLQKGMDLHLEVVETGREAPDFVVSLEGRRIGVEVAEAVDQSVASADPELSRLSNEVHQELNRRGFNIVVAGIADYASLPRLRTGKERRRNRDSIIELVKDVVEDLTEARRYGQPELEERYRIDCLWSLKLLPTDSPSYASFSSAPLGSDLMPQVQKTLTEKGGKLAEYRRNAAVSEVWLVLAAGRGNARALESSIVRQTTYDSDFDRVFWVDEFDGAVFEVQVRPV